MGLLWYLVLCLDVANEFFTDGLLTSLGSEPGMHSKNGFLVFVHRM